MPTAPGFSIGADAASRVNTTPKRSVNPGVAVNLAAYSSCRQLLEQFAENFVEQHEEFHSSGLCICELSPKSTKTAIFKHFEQCRAVTKDSDTLLGDELTLALRSVMLNDTAVRPPTTGNFANLYGSLSTGIHSCNWFRDDMGAVVVPNDLDPSTKRFLIRALLALQEQVVVADSFGSVRLPLPDEINSPDRAKKARKT